MNFPFYLFFIPLPELININTVMSNTSGDYKDAIWIVCDLIKAASTNPEFMEYFLNAKDQPSGLMQALKLLKFLAEEQDRDISGFIHNMYNKV
jgi:hypothetical protein